MEELVAELGAAFLCADLKITNEPRPDHAAYIQSWLEVLKNDRKAVFTAASRAGRAYGEHHSLMRRPPRGRRDSRAA
jgi:antirestriction protein ArdC